MWSTNALFQQLVLTVACSWASLLKTYIQQAILCLYQSTKHESPPLSFTLSYQDANQGHCSNLWPLCSVLTQPMYPIVPSPLKHQEKRGLLQVYVHLVSGVHSTQQINLRNKKGMGGLGGWARMLWQHSRFESRHPSKIIIERHKQRRCKHSVACPKILYTHKKWIRCGHI